MTIQIVPLTLFTLDKQKQHYEHNKLEYTNTMNMRNMTTTTSYVNKHAMVTKLGIARHDDNNNVEETW